MYSIYLVEYSVGSEKNRWLGLVLIAYIPIYAWWKRRNLDHWDSTPSPEHVPPPILWLENT